MSDERRQKVREMIERGSTRAEVALELGISVGTVHNDLVRSQGGMLGRMRKVAKQTVEKATEVVETARMDDPTKIKRAAWAEILKAQVEGREIPRSLRIHLFSPATAMKYVKEIKVAMEKSGDSDSAPYIRAHLSGVHDRSEHV